MGSPSIEGGYGDIDGEPIGENPSMGVPSMGVPSMGVPSMPFPLAHTDHARSAIDNSKLP
jgi:hypothetical protein